MKKYIPLLPVLALTVTSANGLTPRRLSAGSTLGTSSSNNYSSAEVTKPVYTNVRGSVTQSCSKEDMQRNISYDFLRTLMGDEDIKIFKSRDGSQFRVIVPNYIQACLDLKYDVMLMGNDHIVKFRNDYDFDYEELAEEGESPDSFRKLSIEDKYFRCIGKKYPELIDEHTSAFNRVKAFEDGHLRQMTIEHPISGMDKDRSSKLYIASPDYSVFNQAVHGKVENYRPPSDSEWKCTYLENASGGPLDTLVYESQNDKEARKAYSACRSNELSKVIDELDRLKSDNSDIGNAGQLIAILEGVKDKLREEKANELLDRLRELENELIPSDEDLEDGKELAINDKQEIYELLEDYNKVLKQYENLVVDTGIVDLYELAHQRSVAKTPEEKASIDKRVAKLNELISGFGRHSDKDEFKYLVDAMKNHNFGIKAKEIFTVKSKSENFGNVYFEKNKREREKKLTFSKAEKSVKADIDRFEKNVLTEWRDVSQLKRGKDAPLKRLRNRMQSLQSRRTSLISNYQQNYQNDMQKYCYSGYNQYSCQMAQYRQQMNQYLLQKQLGKVQTSSTNLNNQYAGWMRIYQDSMMQRNLASVNNNDSLGGSDLSMWGYDMGMNNGLGPLNLGVQQQNQFQVSPSTQIPSNVLRFNQ